MLSNKRTNKRKSYKKIQKQFFKKLSLQRYLEKFDYFLPKGHLNIYLYSYNSFVIDTYENHLIMIFMVKYYLILKSTQTKESLMKKNL